MPTNGEGLWRWTSSRTRVGVMVLVAAASVVVTGFLVSGPMRRWPAGTRRRWSS